MNIKKSLFATLLASAALSASAQEAKTEYVFQPHWYVQGQFGAQYTLGEIAASKLYSPNAQLGVGYNFGKVVGARFGINAWQSKGGSEIDGTTYKWKYNYVAPSLDVTFNLSNLIAGVNPNRIVDITAFAGCALNIAFNNQDAQDVDNTLTSKYGMLTTPSKYEITGQFLGHLWDNTNASVVGRAGLMADFKVSEKVSVGLEFAANFLSDKYNSKNSDNVDWYFNGLVGMKYNLGGTYTTKTIEPEVKIVYKDRIVEKVVEKIVEKPVEVVTKDVAEVQPLRLDVFFNIAAFKLLASEQQKVNEVAEYMKKFPQSKVTITGLADKGTGNDAINIPLSKKRAEIVKDMLVKKYGIDPSRITAEGKGSSEQPYTIPELNRVSICVVK